MPVFKLPPKVKPGERPRAADHNALIDALNALVLLPGVGYQVKNGPNGQSLSLRLRGGSSNQSCSLSVRLFKNESNAWKAVVAPGIADSMLHSSGSTYEGVPLIGTERIDANPVPELSVSGAGGVYFKVTWHPVADEVEPDVWAIVGGELVKVEVHFATTTPTPTVPTVDGSGNVSGDGVSFWLAASVVEDGDNFKLSGKRCGNRDIVICDGSGNIRMIWSGS